MRIVVEIPDRLAARVIEIVEAEHFHSVDALVTAAIDRLLDDSSHAAGPRSRDMASEAAIADEAASRQIGSYVFDARPDAPWLWGMINRVFPLKLAARVCAELTAHGPVPIPKLHALFAERGLQIGRKLKAADLKAGRLRNESLSVGFPLGDDEQKAKVRFAHQFLGRRNASGLFTGGAFEIGLIGPTDPDSDSVAPTLAGLKFAALPNPILDADAESATLDPAEHQFYLFEIAARIPAERNALSAVLSILASGPLDVGGLAARLRPYQRANDASSVQDTSRSGALARFSDVGAIQRNPDGRSASYEKTPLGARVMERLRSVPTEIKL